MVENESSETQIQIPIPIPPATPLRKEPSFWRWCGDECHHHQIDTAAASPGEEESDGVDLPLLRSESDKANLESDSPRFNEFRQRSMHLSSSPSLDYLVTIGKNYVPLDIENGLDTSESMEKLDSLGSSLSSSSFSVAMVLKTLFFILLWYNFSTLLTLYNNTLLRDNLGKFPVPLMMNTMHFGMQAVLSNAIVFFQSKCCENNTRGPTMAWKDYFFRVVPTALATALDINLSNASLIFISVTFATMCKSASPIFLLMFAFAFRLESPSFKLLGIILVISVGFLLTVSRETQFEFWGFLFAMLAAVMSGFRWCMTQILLQKEAKGLKNPITLMSYVTPVMTVVTAIFSLMLDPWHYLSKNEYFDTSSHIIQSCLLMLLGGALAFFMVLTEYILVSATSAVTVTIAGIVKEAVTILVAVFYFHDQFTWKKGIGLFTIIVGVSLFNRYKYQNLSKGHSSECGDMNSSTFNGAAKYVILDEDILDSDT